MEIILVRHGVTEYNKARRYQGQVDIPLSEEGLEMLAKADTPVDRVYVSPLSRATQTAEAVFGESEMIPKEGLLEMNFGVFDGRTADEMADDEAYTEWVNGMCQGRCPGGEDMAEFTDRTVGAFKAIMADEDDDAVIAVVAHGGTQMAVLSELADEEKAYWMWQTKPGCGYRLRWNGENLSVIEEVAYVKGGETCK